MDQINLNNDFIYNTATEPINNTYSQNTIREFLTFPETNKQIINMDSGKYVDITWSHDLVISDVNINRSEFQYEQEFESLFPQQHFDQHQQQILYQPQPEIQTQVIQNQEQQDIHQDQMNFEIHNSHYNGPYQSVNTNPGYIPANQCQQQLINQDKFGIPDSPADSGLYSASPSPKLQIQQLKTQTHKSDSLVISQEMNNRVACAICKKTFSKNCYLLQHNRTAHVNLPLRCSICGKKYAIQEVLNIHIERHIALVKKFKCTQVGCTKQFNHMIDLRRHRESSHSKIKSHVCHMCNKGFARKDHMIKHMDTHRNKNKK